MADAELKLVISADNADAIKKVKEFSQTLDGVSVASDKTKKSQDDLAASVFKGQAAWDMLKTGLKEVEGFVIDSTKAYLEAENKMSLVRSTVESLGMAYENVQPQITAFQEKMSRLGVDDEDAALSMVKLAKAAGGDMAKGMQLAKLASDLTASGIGDLASNTDNLQKILIGKGARALLEYRINLDDTATTAEQLDAVQKKVTRTTEELADTTDGKIKVMQEAFQNLKEEIGGGFVLALQNAIGSGENMNKTLDNINETGKQGKIIIFSLTNIAIALGEGFMVAAKGFASFAGGIYSLKIRLTEGKEAADAYKKSLADGVIDSVDAFKTAINNAINPTDALTNAQKQLESQTKNTGKTSVVVGENVKNANETSTDAVDAHKKKVQDLTDKYNESKNKISSDLVDLATSHQEKMASIQESIKNTQQSITDLEQSYNQTKTDDVKSVAEKIVESENKVADIKEQLAKATTADEKLQLQKQLADEQKNLDSSKDWQLTHTAEMAEAERRAKETDLQRTIEDYNAKRILADQDYAEKLARLNQEVVDLTNKNTREIALYIENVTKKKEQLDKETDDYKKAMKDEQDAAVSSANAQTVAYNNLANAKARAGIKSTVVATVAPTNNSNIDSTGTALIAPGGMPKFAEGGIVNGPTIALVGEAGPEAIIPLSKMGNGATINININGAIFSQDAAQKLGDIILNKLKMQMSI